MSNNPTLPIGLDIIQMFNSLAAVPKQQSQFLLKILVQIGQFEIGGSVPKDMLFLIDCSPSMYESLGSADRMTVAKKAIIDLISDYGPEDRVALVAFDKGFNPVLGWTNCDAKGKDSIEGAVSSISMGSGTQYYPGLEHAFSLFETGDPRRKRGVIKLTDGEDFGLDDPISLCAKARTEKGLTVYAGGIDVKPKHRERLIGLSNNNFASFNTAEGLVAFLQGADAQASMAAITNARLVLNLTNMANVEFFHGATKNERMADSPGNYIEPDLSGKGVVLGNLLPGEDFGIYAKLNVTLPDDINVFPTGKMSVRKSFGDATLIGDIPSQGVTGQILKTKDIVVKFATESSESPNETVVTFYRLANAVRELSLARSASGADKQQHFDKAAQEMDKAAQTAAFNNDEAAKKFRARLNAMRKSSGGKAEAAQADMQGATASFDPKAASARFKAKKQQQK